MTLNPTSRAAHNLRDLTGQKFYRWTVIHRTENANGGSAAWLCRCECGTEAVVAGKKLRCGHSKSCGCLRSDKSSERHRTHGLSKTPEYRIWKGIIKRCENPKAASYGRYGGRGITIFPGWRNDFTAFLVYIGPRPSSKHSVDRYPNQDGNYEPGNVRWATSIEQQRNKWNNRRLTLNGETMPTSAWAERLGINGGTLKDRIENRWSHERALTAKVRTIRNKTLEFNGETHSLIEWSRRVGIRPDTLSYRLSHGWSARDALCIPASPSNCGRKNPAKRISGTLPQGTQ